MVTLFIKWVVGEEDFNEFSASHKAKPRQILKQPPILLVFDTAHMMDVPSWRLFENIKASVSRIGVILLLQTDSMDVLKIHPESQVEFDRVWLNTELRVIDLPCLDHKGLV